MKKYSKYLFVSILSFFFSLTITYAKEYTLTELAERVKEIEPNASYVYVIGEYAFTSSHILSTQDAMLAARSIKVNDVSGAVEGDPIFDEMAIVFLNGIVDSNFDLVNFEFRNAIVGDATAQETYDIKYIDYEDAEFEMYDLMFIDENQELLNVRVRENTKIALYLDDVKIADKEGYRFDGWKNQTTGEMLDEAMDTVTSNVTYEAVWVKTTETVTNEEEFIKALADKDIDTIILGNDIEIDFSLVAYKNVLIDGTENNYTIRKSGTPVWISGGDNYILKVYNSTEEPINVTLTNVKLTNAMGAMMVGNNAIVTVDNVDVDGNVWGGIEVKDTEGTVLNVNSINYTEEKFAHPVVWVDKETVENAKITFNGIEIFDTVINNGSNNQVQYYLDENNIAKATVDNKEDFMKAYRSSDVKEINLEEDLELENSLGFAKNVTINGNGNTLTANHNTGGSFIDITSEGNVIINDLTIDANNKSRGISVKGNLELNNSTITNGKASDYASGLFVTGKGTAELTESTITGNAIGSTYQDQYYNIYSTDIWIGSEATGVINSGTYGNVFVNGNEYPDGGNLTVNDGKIDLVYLEYDRGTAGDLFYKGGTIDKLLISTYESNGDFMEYQNVEFGDYKAGLRNLTCSAIITEEELVMDQIVEVSYSVNNINSVLMTMILKEEDLKEAGIMEEDIPLIVETFEDSICSGYSSYAGVNCSVTADKNINIMVDIDYSKLSQEAKDELSLNQQPYDELKFDLESEGYTCK